MTGSSTTSWTFASRVVTPAALVVAEATWVSLLVNAAVNTSSGPHVYLPFLALAVPAVVAVVVGAGIARPGWRWWWQVAVLAPAMVIGAALSAGVISQLARSGSLWLVASQPWTAVGHPAAVTAGVAWSVAGLAWARGTWLGLSPPSFRQAAWSMGLAGVAFVAVFAGRADAHATAFRAATGPAGWLLFVAFPFGMAAMVLIRQGDLEEQVLHRAGRRPGTVWLTVLAVPMLVVALVALALAVVVGPAAPVVGRAVARTTEAAWWVVATAFGALWHLVPSSHPARPARVPKAHERVTVPSTQPSHAALGISPVVGHVIAVVVAVGMVVLIVLVARHFRPLGRLRGKPPDLTEHEERDSVFTWRHLAAQLRNAVLAFLRRFRRRPPDGQDVPTVPVPTGDDITVETVRHAYRRMLVAARASGHGRLPTETTGELENRLSRGPAASAAAPLAGLTARYDAARYGELHADGPAPGDAVAQADVVSSVLVDQLPVPGGREA